MKSEEVSRKDAKARRKMRILGLKRDHNRSAAEPEQSGDSQRQMAEHSMLNNEANGRG